LFIKSFRVIADIEDKEQYVLKRFNHRQAIEERQRRGLVIPDYTT
jgi:hypothetical protein